MKQGWEIKILGEFIPNFFGLSNASVLMLYTISKETCFN